MGLLTAVYGGLPAEGAAVGAQQMRARAEKEVAEAFPQAQAVPGRTPSGYREFSALVPKLAEPYQLPILEAGLQLVRNGAGDPAFRTQLLPQRIASAMRAARSPEQAAVLATLIGRSQPDWQFDVDPRIWKLVEETPSVWAQRAFQTVLATRNDQGDPGSVNLTNRYPADQLWLHLQQAARVDNPAQLDAFQTIQRIDPSFSYHLGGFFDDSYAALYRQLAEVKSPAQAELFRQIEETAQRLAYRSTRYHQNADAIYALMKPFLPAVTELPENPGRAATIRRLLRAMEGYSGSYTTPDGEVRNDPSPATNQIVRTLLPQAARWDSPSGQDFLKKFILHRENGKLVIDERWLGLAEKGDGFLRQVVQSLGKDFVGMDERPRGLGAVVGRCWGAFARLAFAD
jgi:hypothetical protein